MCMCVELIRSRESWKETPLINAKKKKKNQKKKEEQKRTKWVEHIVVYCVLHYRLIIEIKEEAREMENAKIPL